MLDSSIILNNNGIGFGGPLPGQAGIKTPGGTAEFSVVTRYNDLFGNPAGGLDTWVVLHGHSGGVLARRHHW